MKRSTIQPRASYSMVLALFLAVLVHTTAHGQSRQLSFSGQDWDVRNNAGGPGPNIWSDDTDDVWVDGSDRLHLTFQPDGAAWSATEVVSTQSFGYGEYRWKLNSNFEGFDPNVVLGLFTYLDDVNEIDIEYSKFGDANKPLGNFVTQPAVTGNIQSFEVDLNGDFTTHRFVWSPDQIKWSSHHGHYDEDPPAANLIHAWSYSGQDIPVEANERVHMNLWGFNGNPPVDGLPVEIVISEFQFTPLENLASVPEPASGSFLLLGSAIWAMRRVKRLRNR